MTELDKDPFDELWRSHEDFILRLCNELEISYEDSDEEDVIREIRKLKEYRIRNFQNEQ